MLQETRLDLSELGELAEIIPGHEPELKVSIKRIPVSELDLGRKIIPVCEPMLGGNEIEYVMDCLETNWISSAGKYIPAFEEQFAQHCSARYGVACANGTVALHLALATLGIGPGDEVIIPTFTMIATANAVAYTGAKPVLVDSEMRTWNMDVDQIEAKVTEKTKAIMPMHTYGHPMYMDKVWEIAEEYGLYVVEDAAESHGAEYKGQRTGSLGDAGCFSFYANKIITTGEGGMVTTNNEQIAKLASNLRDHAFSEERHFWHKYLGFNYRMTNLQAAVGLAQTERFEEFVQRRRDNAYHYTPLLKDISGITTPPEESWAKSVFWMYSILLDDEFGLSRDELREKLAERGIETRTFFIPIHLQPIYFRAFKGERYPVAEDLCKGGLYLPSASSLTKEEIEYVVEQVVECRVQR
jgi:perosamine synthetase